MRRWRRARWLHMKATQGKNTVNEMVEHFTGWILEAGGPLGRVLSRGLACARRRHACEATDAVFPLPLLPPLGHPKVFCAKGLASAGRAWVNVIIAALNFFMQVPRRERSVPLHRRLRTVGFMSNFVSPCLGFWVSLRIGPAMPEFVSFSA